MDKLLKKTTTLFALFLLLACAPKVFAQGGPGTTGAVALKIPLGARPIAMGQAFVAVADDANSIYWNPAGLRQLGGIQITLQHDVFIETVRYDYFAGAAKLSKDIGVGLSVFLMGTGTEDATSGPGVIGENFMNVNLAGAIRLNYNFDLGLTAKYVSEDLLAGGKASTFAFDLGLMYKTPIPKLTAGLNFQNVGLDMKFDAESDPLPFNVRLGLAYKMFDDDFTVALDTNLPNDNAIAISLGGEYWYKDTLVGRFGYRFQGDIDQNQYGIGGKAGLYLGAGAKIKAFNTYVGLDYAWTDTGFFGSNHHFALDVYL